MPTVSGIPDSVGIQFSFLLKMRESALNQCTVWQLTECDDTRYSRHKIFFPPEDEHIDTRNMSRNIV